MRNNPEDKICARRILNARRNFITEKIKNKPIAAPENQIELGILMYNDEFDFLQNNGLINYKDYSTLPFSRKEQKFVCEMVKKGRYKEYIYEDKTTPIDIKK